MNTEPQQLPWVSAVDVINRLLALMNGNTYVANNSKEVH